MLPDCNKQFQGTFLHYFFLFFWDINTFEYLCPNLSNGRTYLRGVTTLTSILKFSQNLNRHEVDSSSTSFDIYLPYVFIRLWILSNWCGLLFYLIHAKGDARSQRIGLIKQVVPHHFFCLYKWNFILKITFSREKNMFGLRT